MRKKVPTITTTTKMTKKKNILIVVCLIGIGYTNIMFLLNTSSFQRNLIQVYKRKDEQVVLIEYDYDNYSIGHHYININNININNNMNNNDLNTTRNKDLMKEQQQQHGENNVNNMNMSISRNENKEEEESSSSSLLNHTPKYDDAGGITIGKKFKLKSADSKQTYNHPYQGKSNNASSTSSSSWLVNRNTNINEPEYMTDELVQSLILRISPLDNDNGSYDIFDQTICYKESRFRSWEEEEEYDDDDDNEKKTHYLKYLANRLMFLAIHDNQHRPARAEAISRYYSPPPPPPYGKNDDDDESGYNNASTTTSTTTTGGAAAFNNNDNNNQTVGNFDFQCDPNTQYIVANLGENNGMGMVIRMNAIEPILFGIMSNRVVLWNNIHNSNFFNCQRRDWQCLFQPMSPCIISQQQDIQDAPMLTKEDLKHWRTTGRIPSKYRKERIIQMWSDLPTKEPKGIRQAFVRIITSLYNHNAVERRNQQKQNRRLWDLNPRTLLKVKEYILDTNSTTTSDIGLFSLPLLYMLRPNFRLRNEIDAALQKYVPNDFDPNKAIGIPIRAGDKCNREQQCFGFDKYMNLVTKMAMKRSNHTSNTYDTIVLTSESKGIMQSRFNYTNDSSNANNIKGKKKDDLLPFRRFIVNGDDTLQGHGSTRNYNNNLTQFNAEDVMISTMIAMKLQLLPETLIPNACSNFHKVFAGFYNLGCGMAKHPYMEWLQSNDDPTMRMNCQWKTVTIEKV